MWHLTAEVINYFEKSYTDKITRAVTINKIIQVMFRQPVTDINGVETGVKVEQMDLYVQKSWEHIDFKKWIGKEANFPMVINQSATRAFISGSSKSSPRLLEKKEGFDTKKAA